MKTSEVCIKDRQQNKEVSDDWIFIQGNNSKKSAPLLLALLAANIIATQQIPMITLKELTTSNKLWQCLTQVF